jgi:hypothetical protein
VSVARVLGGFAEGTALLLESMTYSSEELVWINTPLAFKCNPEGIVLIFKESGWAALTKIKENNKHHAALSIKHTDKTLSIKLFFIYEIAFKMNIMHPEVLEGCTEIRST